MSEIGQTISNEDLIELLVASNEGEKQLQEWDDACTKLGSKRMKEIASDRWMITDATLSLFTDRIYPLLDDPKKNLSRCRQPTKILFALRDSEWEKTPKFATWAAEFQTKELLSGKVKPNTINTYLFRERHSLDVDEIPILIQRFGIVRIHEKNGDILEKTMLDNPKLFFAIGSYLTVSETTKHPIALARASYLRCGIDGGRGSNDQAYWLKVAAKLDRPPSGQLTPKKLKAFTQAVREELVTAHAASLKANKQLLFVIGENHLSSVSWLYELAL